MAVSRRFESRFKIVARRTILGAGVNYMQPPTLTSDPQASALSRVQFGVPTSGCAFIAYTYEPKRWFFVASNVAPGYNGVSVYPATTLPFTDAVWGRVPSVVRWYEQDIVEPILQLAASGSTVRTIDNYRRYAMSLSFYHQVNIVNNSPEVFRVWIRDFGGVNFVESGDLIGYPAGTKFNTWRAVDIPANDVYLFQGFEPLEIKVNSDSSPSEIYGLKRQDGNKFILRGANYG